LFRNATTTWGDTLHGWFEPVLGFRQDMGAEVALAVLSRLAESNLELADPGSRCLSLGDHSAATFDETPKPGGIPTAQRSSAVSSWISQSG
jgi:hypothetical protein